MGLRISYLQTKLKLGQYFDEATPKISIFLHHTAGGGAEEAVRWWNQTPERVGTALFVERDGRALQCCEIATWAWHLGVTYANTKQNKLGIGIELVSRGFVIPEVKDKETTYYAYPLWPLKTQRVKIPTDQVVELDQTWRGFKFWHKYTDEQVKTTVELMKYLVKRFDIKVQKDLTKFWEYDESVAKQNKPGIWAHTTVRKDKFDIFPQPSLIKAIQEAFKS